MTAKDNYIKRLVVPAAMFTVALLGASSCAEGEKTAEVRSSRERITAIMAEKLGARASTDCGYSEGRETSDGSRNSWVEAQRAGVVISWAIQPPTGKNYVSLRDRDGVVATVSDTSASVRGADGEMSEFIVNGGQNREFGDEESSGSEYVLPSAEKLIVAALESC